MSALLAFVAGLLTALALWRAMAPQFHESDVLRRQNYRGHELPVASGVIVVLAVVAVSAAYSVFIRFGADAAVEQVRLANLLAYSGTALGYGLLGLLDDLVGATATKGFRSFSQRGANLPRSLQTFCSALSRMLHPLRMTTSASSSAVSVHPRSLSAVFILSPS